MPKRKRKGLTLTDKLAATLACLLPAEQRDDLRKRRLPAKVLLSLFEFHHIQFHSLDGSDDWYNLHPMQKEDHRVRSKSDTSVVAKIRHQEAKWSEFTAAMSKGRKPPKKKSKWQSRPFQTRRKK